MGAAAWCTVHVDIAAQGAQGFAAFIGADAHACPFGRVEWLKQSGTDESIIHADSGVDNIDDRLAGFFEAAQAIVEIADTGSGMDEAFIRTRLFQPFDSTKGAGMGIGAYECRETLRALGGNIEVESTPGRGTRFRLSLPLDNNAYAGGDAA